MIIIPIVKAAVVTVAVKVEVKIFLYFMKENMIAKRWSPMIRCSHRMDIIRDVHADQI